MDRLAQAGASVDTMNIYHQLPAQELSAEWLSRVDSGEIHAITATSKNIASHTVALLGERSRNQNWLSLSPAITARLHDLGCMHVETASEPSLDALVDLANAF